jgi:hypothetical protein
MRPAAWLLTIGIVLASSEGRASEAGFAYCAIWTREAVRIDLLHTIPVKPDEVTDSYIESLAVQVFRECVSVLPALLPLPEQHRSLKTWVGDMRFMVSQRDRTASVAGTVPASAAPDDDAWREACRSEYRTWDEADGTVIRNGNPERVRCPLALVDGAWVLP